MYEIIYVCNSVNNKNVRRGELEILRKVADNELCFEFGKDEMNLKKRFYSNKEDLEKDYNALLKLKEKESAEEITQEVVEEIQEKEEVVIEEKPVVKINPNYPRPRKIKKTLF